MTRAVDLVNRAKEMPVTSASNNKLAIASRVTIRLVYKLMGLRVP